MTTTVLAADDPGRPDNPFGDPGTWVETTLIPFAAVQARYDHGHHGPDLDAMPWLTARSAAVLAKAFEDHMAKPYCKHRV